MNCKHCTDPASISGLCSTCSYYDEIPTNSDDQVIDTEPIVLKVIARANTVIKVLKQQSHWGNKADYEIIDKKTSRPIAGIRDITIKISSPFEPPVVTFTVIGPEIEIENDPGFWAIPEKEDDNSCAYSMPNINISAMKKSNPCREIKVQ